MAVKVLVVDDEKIIVKGLTFSLEQDGMEVDCAYDGEEALEMASSKEYDIILLDLMLPKLGGYEVCQRIREFSRTPIIMLTAKGEDMDKILGLEYGADDYMTKPFNILEVKARIKAVMRRSKSHEQARPAGNNLTLGDITLDLSARRTFRGGAEILLTSKEFEMLRILMENPGKVYKREWKARKGLSCHCVEMVDIGVYNTCKHFCKYCYANYDEKKVISNSLMHNPKSSLLIGELSSDDVIKIRRPS